MKCHNVTLSGTSCLSVYHLFALLFFLVWNKLALLSYRKKNKNAENSMSQNISSRGQTSLAGVLRLKGTSSTKEAVYCSGKVSPQFAIAASETSRSSTPVTDASTYKTSSSVSSWGTGSGSQERDGEDCSYPESCKKEFSDNKWDEEYVGSLLRLLTAAARHMLFMLLGPADSNLEWKLIPSCLFPGVHRTGLAQSHRSARRTQLP